MKIELGNVYFPETDSDNYRSVFIELDDDSPQVYLTVPVRVFDTDIDVTMCVWIHEKAIDELIEVLKALRKRYEEVRCKEYESTK